MGRTTIELQRLFLFVGEPERRHLRAETGELKLAEWHHAGAAMPGELGRNQRRAAKPASQPKKTAKSRRKNEIVQ